VISCTIDPARREHGRTIMRTHRRGTVLVAAALLGCGSSPTNGSEETDVSSGHDAVTDPKMVVVAK
jgi:hypothetical protein